MSPYSEVYHVFIKLIDFGGAIMCGFVGVWGAGDSSGEVISSMSAFISLRGPDDFGYWGDENYGIGLGHRRLSVIDLSAAGHQPMLSDSGRFVIAFNGEIYNHSSLRAELENSGSGILWRGDSDTETLLAGFDYWGVEETIRRSVGMFAFAVWDREERALMLVRDRLGEKPLYYGLQGNVFLFGSDLAALRIHPAFSANVCRDAVAAFLQLSYVPTPLSIYQGVRKLDPGCILTLKEYSSVPTVVRYCSGSDIAARGGNARFEGGPEEAVNQLEHLLRDSVRSQMISDVPLGAFLSGGVDSSAVVALMQSVASKPVKTFSIGFDSKGYNEAVYASEVAKYLGTAHTELYVSPRQALDVIPKLPEIYTEPFADSSQIPTFLVSQLAREQVSVCLSGDGGDELFCGYNRYRLTNQYWGKLAITPLSIRRLISGGVLALPPETIDWLAKRVPSLSSVPNIGDKMHKAAHVVRCRNVQEVYSTLISQHKDATSLVIGGEYTNLMRPCPLMKQFNDVERMMLLDMCSYLPDDILVKLDRASMGVSLESRVPFLDHRLVEFAWSLPLNIKLKDGVSKWPLRQVLYKHVPPELIDRPKMGFGVPLDSWLRGPLRDWAETLLSEDRINREGYLRAEPIRHLWNEHLSGRSNRAYILWNVLMFQAWLESNGLSYHFFKN